MDNVGEKTLEVMSQAEWYNKWLLNQFKEYLGKRILEVGAGAGNFTQELAEFGEVCAIDIDRRYFETLKNIKNISSGFGNIESGKYFFSSKNFDSVVCLNVLEHVKNDEKALKNMHKLINANGDLVLLVPANQFLFSKFDKTLGHFRRYSLGDVVQKLNYAGFSDISARYLNWWGAIGWFVWFKLTGWKMMPKRQVGIFNFLGKIFLWPEKYIELPFGLSVLAVARK